MSFVHKCRERGQAGGREGVDIGCNARSLTQDVHGVVNFNDIFSFKDDSVVVVLVVLVVLVILDVVLFARQCGGVVLII